MKIGQKLALGFFVAVLCIWVTTFFAKNILSNIHEEFELLKEDIIPDAIEMAEMGKIAFETAHWLMDYMAYGEEENIEKIQSCMETINKHALSHLEHALSHLELETHIGLEEQKAANEIVVKTKIFIAEVEKIIDSKKQGVSADELVKMETETVHPAMAILSHLALQRYLR